MKAKKQSRKRGVLLAGSIFLFCVMAGLISLLWFVYRVHHIPSDRIREEDIAALLEGDYEAVILSMYTPESFDADEFGYFRGLSTVQAFHSFVNLADMGDYLEHSFSGNDNLSNIYIGLDPFAVSKLYGYHTSLYARDYEKYLTEYVQEHNNVIFEFLIPAYSMEYMRSLSDNEYTELINAYRNLVNIYIPYDNVVIYFFGYEEWLIANSGNYVSPTSCNTSVLRTAVAYTIRDNAYALRPDNMEERFARMTELVQNSSVTYPNLSDLCIVFFGDSVLTYNTGSTSIPGVVGSLSGAQVYNCAQGGLPASGNPNMFFNLNGVINHFLTQDISGTPNDNFERGLTGYIEENHDGKKHCFVLNVGLNDYFSGLPIENPADAYDTETYAGALRTGIRSLKEAYPDALILVMTPTYSVLFSGGTERNSEVGGFLTDYVDAAVRVAEEMDVYCKNNYFDSGINAENQADYLNDGTHPNETGSFCLGRQIVEYIGHIVQE